jgi:superfamily I DNA and/or RNA helicase
MHGVGWWGILVTFPEIILTTIFILNSLRELKFTRFLALTGFHWPQDGAGIAFVHSEGAERKDGESRTNPEEVQHVLDILVNVLKQKELGVLDVGIVSPYAAQVRALRQALRRELPGRLRGCGVDLTGGLPGRQGQRALEIASVDAFQGREKELT